ncbi:hypothetical protein L211DRAFT_381045 [Terfezia boudieri ATCC MYA-4762]|uniref:Uncharacterized protein n=1 Tax=Terfezia boudieri ATCC MYA-4762 TaxID=1051890 RepID=A0A3N4M354_9PEZI|nr:hypothetical protein L211DRAFT_381045 [Terfezia boudieri ATCC MYA-4762]
MSGFYSELFRNSQETLRLVRLPNAMMSGSSSNSNKLEFTLYSPLVGQTEEESGTCIPQNIYKSEKWVTQTTVGQKQRFSKLHQQCCQTQKKSPGFLNPETWASTLGVQSKSSRLDSDKSEIGGRLESSGNEHCMNKLSNTPATKGLSTSYVYLTSYGIAIGFPTVFKRYMATHCFRDWTMNFIPGATIENPGSLTSRQTERASFAIYYIHTRDIKAQFLEDLERFEALFAKRKAKEKVPKTLESALRVRLQGHYDEFSRKNPLVYHDRFWSPVRYRVLSIRQITNRFGVKTDTWKIEVNSKKAAEVISQEGKVVWFFGAETNGAYRWKNKEPAGGGLNGKQKSTLVGL